MCHPQGRQLHLPELRLRVLSRIERSPPILPQSLGKHAMHGFTGPRYNADRTAYSRGVGNGNDVNGSEEAIVFR